MTTFVLIPGAGGAAAYWHRVVPLLEAGGLRAVPVDLPADDDRAGLTEYATLVSECMGDHDDVVLVAQSMGGWPTEFDLETYFLHDVSREAFEQLEHRAEADVAFASVCDFGSWPDVPIHVVAGADDRFFPLEFQRRVARDRLGLEVDDLPGGHLMALSRPDELAAYLLDV